MFSAFWSVISVCLQQDFQPKYLCCQFRTNITFDWSDNRQSTDSIALAGIRFSHPGGLGPTLREVKFVGGFTLMVFIAQCWVGTHYMVTKCYQRGPFQRYSCFKSEGHWKPLLFFNSGSSKRLKVAQFASKVNF